MHDMEMDACRDLLANSGAFVKIEDINDHMRRAVAIQEVMTVLKQAIPAPSHSHPTIIPLTTIQAEVVDTMIDFAYDYADDTVTDPVFVLGGTPVSFDMTDIRKQLNDSIDNLVAAAELKACWQMMKHY